MSGKGGSEPSFVEFGTSVEQIDDVDSLAQLSSKNQEKALKVTDKQGRVRFHGAFTGGFSAGYYNTVGSKDGWAPSTFVSKRREQTDDEKSSRPEDYMDEEDLEQFGIAPRQLQTSDRYMKAGSSGGQEQRAAWDAVVPGMLDVIQQTVKPVKDSVAMKILRLMGWKEGQGVGPRMKRKSRIHGPARDDQEEESDDDYEPTGDITFAPRDLNPIDFHIKDNIHGIGYQPLSAPKFTDSRQEEERLTFGGKRGISGQAFGVGEDEDEDDLNIYTKDRLSDYDAVLGDEPEISRNYGRQKHREHVHQWQSKESGGIDGFCKATEKLQLSAMFPFPPVPPGYIPRPVITEASDQPKITGKLDSNIRRLMLGDASDYMSLMAKKSDEKSNDPAAPTDSIKFTLQSSKFSAPQQLSPPGSPSSKLSLTSDQELLPPPRSTEPLAKGGFNFRPFTKYPEKQARYDKYLELKSRGDRDAYRKVAPPEFRRGEKEREKEEFERSGSFFKNLTGVMASRFTRGDLPEDDDSKVHVRIDEESADFSDDKQRAVQMKLFGHLTRESYEWHPHRLLCKRLNVPDPYPDSQLVGLPTVEKDKISAYNFLDIEALTTVPAERALKLKEMEEKAKLAEKERGTGDTSEVKSEITEHGKPAMDLFKAVFADSSDSDSSGDEEKSSGVFSTSASTSAATISHATKNQISSQASSQSKLQSLQEAYGGSRALTSDFQQTADKTADSVDTFKPKFLSKKERERKANRKSRWGPTDDIVKEEDNSEVPNIKEEKIIHPESESTVCTESLDTPTKELEEVPTIKIESSDNSLTVDNQPDHSQHQSPENLPSAADKTTAASDDEDEMAWMPALPPGMLSSSLHEKQSSSVSRSPKHKKHKDKHKKKHKKSSKEHKSRSER